MIWTFHLLFGAFLVSTIESLPLAFVLAFLSHYFLDFLPAWEYSLKNIKYRIWKRSVSDFLRIFLDFSLGVFLILLFAKNFWLALAGGIIAIVPDGFDFIDILFKTRIFSFQGKIQFLTHEKKIPLFWGLFTEAVVAFVAIFFLAA